ncbi:MAG TPA: HIT family protein [Chitinophagaceae bacterium]|nr:HIT family protein [Chitinophagaceae bacterium]HNU14032.1 HIT family protein [Chitinophagaceae bacterium]
MLERIKYYLLSLKSKLFGGMTIFSRIIAGDIPCYKIAENEKFFAFLDIFPLREGHVLVVPKTEVDNLFDLPPEYLQEMLLFAKPIAKAIEAAFDCNRCGISVIGLEVPHAHMHLIPIQSANDINFTQAKPKASDESLRAVQGKILNKMN